MEEDDDQWSYSFPPSTEDLSQVSVEGVKNVDHQSKISSNSIASFHALTSSNNYLNDNKKLEIVARRDSLASSGELDSVMTHAQREGGNESNLENQNRDYISPDYARPEMRNASLQISNDEDNSRMANQQALFLQPASISKSTPADPQTTKRDASSIISKENASNALASLGDSPKLPPSPPTPRNDLRSSLKYWQQSSISETAPLHAVEQISGSDEMESASPKIITYRKTTHVRQISNTLRSGDPEKTFDPKLYVNEIFKDTGYRYTTMKRNVEFHQIFKSIDLTDRLLDDFACAISREILLQGRVYITESHLCFNSNLLGWVTSLVIPHSDILRIDKKSTAGLFPNAISVETKHATHNFASFLSRDATFEFLRAVWSAATGQDLSELDSHPIQSLESINNSERRISDYIMSIDEGDNVDIEWNDENSEEIEKQASEGIASQFDVDNDENSSSQNSFRLDVSTFVDFKPDSVYQYGGPHSHSQTTIPVGILEPVEEIEVIKDIINAPLGIVSEILFGQGNQEFHKNFLVEQGATEISDYGSFQQSDNDPLKKERCYTYQRPLGYSIGPKATKCCVREVLEHYNFSEYVIVSSTTDTPDVPSGGSFSVITRFYLNWGINNTTEFRIAYFIKWSSRSWIRSMVEKSTLSAQKSVSEILILQLKREIEAQTHTVDTPSKLVSTPCESVITKSPIEHSPISFEKAARTEKIAIVSSRDWVFWLTASLLMVSFVLLISVQWRLTRTVSKLEEIMVKQKDLLSELSSLMLDDSGLIK